MKAKSKKKYSKKRYTNKSYGDKKNEILDRITETFIEKLNGCEKLPWRKPWSKRYGVLAQNLIYQNPYKGANLLLLMDEINPYFLTFNQLRKLQKDNEELKLSKGSRSRKLIAYNINHKLDGKPVIEKGKDFFFKSGSKVSNPKDIITSVYLATKLLYSTEDMENIDHLLPQISEERKAQFLKDRIPICEKFVKQAQADNRIPQIVNGSKACYQLKRHLIVTPKFEYFDNVDAYYATLFHEAIHSTAKKFDRTMGKKFGDDDYSREELVAELGSSMMAAYFGIDNNSLIENQTAYLQGWLSSLKEDNNYLLKSANAASTAVNYLLSDFFDKEAKDKKIEQ